MIGIRVYLQPRLNIKMEKVADVVLYRRDNDGREFIANFNEIPWEEFSGELAERHKVEIDDSGVKELAFGAVDIVTHEFIPDPPGARSHFRVAR